MERQELIDELRGLAAVSSLTPSLKKRIEQLHDYILGRSFIRTSCNNCYHDAIMIMYNHLRKGLEMKGNREFVLKRGVVLQPTFGEGKFYTASTITDDVAREYLREHPEKMSLFEKVGDLDKVVVEEESVVEEVEPATAAAENVEVEEAVTPSPAPIRKKNKHKR